MRRDNLRIGILAGGGSRRMGRDKRQLLYNGRTFLEAIVASAQATGLRVLVIGISEPIIAHELHLLGTIDGTIEYIPDKQAHQGPLAALEAGLSHTSSPLLLLPCDVPLLQSDGVMWLIDAWDREFRAGVVGAEAVGRGLVGRSQRGVEPLFAIYSDALLGDIRGLLRDGELSIRSLLDLPGVNPIDLPTWVSAQLLNVNTPDEYQALS